MSVPAVALVSLLLGAVAAHGGDDRVAPPSRMAIDATESTRIEEALTRLAESETAAAADVEELAGAFDASRRRAAPAGAVRGLASSLAAALVSGSFDEDGIERLAQNLFAALSQPGLTPQEGDLLSLDVAIVLGEAACASHETTAAVGAFRVLLGLEAAPARRSAPRPAPLSLLSKS